MRKAFSMITAIFVMVIMASLLALVSNLASKVTKETSVQYRKEQAVLLAKSYTEFAILAIQGHQMTPGVTPCLRRFRADINSLEDNGTNANGVNNGEGYRVEVSMQYIGLRNLNITCGATGLNTTSHRSWGHQTNNGTNQRTWSNDVSVTVDVYVMYHDIDVVNAILAANPSATIDNATPWVTYHKRTLQKL